MRMELKPKHFLGVAAILVWLTLLIMFSLEARRQELTPDAIPEAQERGVVAWLDAFCKRDFSTCDTMLEQQSHGFYSAQVTALSVDERYYNLVLQKLISCMTDVSVTAIRSEDDSVEYDISVTLQPYIAIESLVCEEDLTALRGSYMDGMISDLEFQTELERVYFELFSSNCFNVDSEAGTCQKGFVLSEKEVNGVICVFGTVDFVDSLLSDSNLTNNVAIYERDVKVCVDSLLKAG